MRWLRLRAVWLIVVPFLWLASPTPDLLAIGGVLSLIGLWIRGWAAGTIHKDEHLTTTGPYSRVRHPLYLGSLFLGLGVSLAGGHWIWPAVYVLYFAGVYGKTMAEEDRRLTGLFPADHPDYLRRVPGFVPHFGSSGSDGSDRFSWSQYRRNREWEAALGAVAAFALLTARVVWF
jgi:protein-S-isoprenylcysteine O-methyltransferase Ste14